MASGELGRQAEELAAEHYHREGYRILHRNFRPPKGRQIGELDLVALRGRELAFVEVKARTSDSFGDALAAVDSNKQRKLVKMCKLYLQLYPEYQDCDYRIDVAAVDIDNRQKPVIILVNAIEDTD